MSRLFQIKPIEWKYDGNLRWFCDAGYTVCTHRPKVGNGGFYWTCPSGLFSCDSIEDGKRKAELHREERLMRELIPVTPPIVEKVDLAELVSFVRTVADVGRKCHDSEDYLYDPKSANDRWIRMSSDDALILLRDELLPIADCILTRMNACKIAPLGCHRWMTADAAKYIEQAFKSDDDKKIEEGVEQ